MTRRILLITVNYKGADATAAFIESASRLRQFHEMQLLIVENGSEDSSAAKLLPVIEQLDNVELLQSSENRGYFGAANWALKQYCSQGHSPDWTIICNNDIVFRDELFLTRLLQYDPNLAHVIAPSIIALPEGVDCNPVMRRRPSNLRLMHYRFWNSHDYLMWFRQWLSPHLRKLRHRLYGRRARTKSKGGGLIYSAHGAFMIFSRSYFELGGYIDDGFFLYAEEFSVAEICRRLDLKIRYEPSLSVWHNAHEITGRIRKTAFAYEREGFDYALRTYFDT